MFLVLVDSNGKRVDERVLEVGRSKGAMAALEECDCGVHLAVITMRSDANESFVSSI